MLQLLAWSFDWQSFLLTIFQDWVMEGGGRILILTSFSKFTSLLKMKLHAEKHLPSWSGSGLKVCGWELIGWLVVMKANLVLRVGQSNDFMLKNQTNPFFPSKCRSFCCIVQWGSIRYATFTTSSLLLQNTLSMGYMLCNQKDIISYRQQRIFLCLN